MISEREFSRFLGLIGWPERPPRNRPFSARSLNTSPGMPRPQSHAFCVGTFDLASVSKIVRSVSNNVRRAHPPVSANVGWKLPLIPRRADSDCALL